MNGEILGSFEGVRKGQGVAHCMLDGERLVRGYEKGGMQVFDLGGGGEWVGFGGNLVGLSEIGVTADGRWVWVRVQAYFPALMLYSIGDWAYAGCSRFEIAEMKAVA